MSAENGSHPFERNTNPRYPLACQRCGRTEEMHPKPQEEFKRSGGCANTSRACQKAEGTMSTPKTAKRRRSTKRRPKHLVALETPYEGYVALNGGEHCGVCGALPKTKRLDRDHDHKTGKPRGLLCHRCNRALPNWMTRDWLLAAVDYLDRSVIVPE